MKNREYDDFICKCKRKINDSPLNLSSDIVDDLSHCVFQNPNQVKYKAEEIRQKFIDNIVDNLLVFENKFTENKGVVHWCIAYDDFFEQLVKLLKNKKIKAVNSFESSFNTELGLDPSLKNEGIHTIDKNNTCSIYEPDLGIVNTGSLFSIFKSAYEMELVLSSKLKIFILPINKFICNIKDIELFSHIYSIYRENVDFPFLSAVFNPDNSAEGTESHVFLVDNGRSNILATKNQRKALLCIDCGACKKVCPVYNTISDEPYNNVFTGPLANVVLPFLENFESHKHLSFNSVLCGNCSKICPVNIPLTDLMIENRNFFFESKIMDFGDNMFASKLKKFLIDRSKMNKKSWRKGMKIKLIIPSSVRKTRQMPKFADESFNVIRTKQQLDR